MTHSYDERVIHDRLAPLARSAKAAVAAATAERLFPLYVLYSHAARESSDPGALRTALDDVWSAVLDGVPHGSSDPYEAALSLVPNADDPSWIPESAFAQNAAAAVAYAWRVWVTDDAQQAAWGLRQAIEAADYAAGSGSSASSGSLVDAAAEAIEHDIAVVESNTDGFRALLAESTSHDSWGWQLADRWHG
ncbi:DUF416 family protein [Leifsonia shinshuensis]|uniref:DUF416 family protein n=1 Tax=Leifsonia shinshuensis TaxID=150026 RepID=UPI001F50BFD8|nr:DUF416 family protein [Leifsonia shinshuensis]MCI0155114.1 DUF416 family protein [Leifsonia shinshuensis]